MELMHDAQTPAGVLIPKRLIMHLENEFVANYRFVSNYAKTLGSLIREYTLISLISVICVNLRIRDLSFFELLANQPIRENWCFVFFRAPPR